MINKKKAGASAIAASLAISVPFIAVHEGKRNDPYYDVAHVQTVCYGETRVRMRRYTNDECKAMLSVAVKGFAERTLAVTPTLRGKVYALAAATSFSYNLGDRRYYDSPVRKRFLAGDIKGGCQAMMHYKKPPSIIKRRKAEVALCMRDVTTSGVKDA